MESIPWCDTGFHQTLTHTNWDYWRWFFHYWEIYCSHVQTYITFVESEWGKAATICTRGKADWPHSPHTGSSNEAYPMGCIPGRPCLGTIPHHTARTCLPIWMGVDDPVWSSMPEALKACQELIKCGCKPGRKCRSCKCGKARLPCTNLCGCARQCDWNTYNRNNSWQNLSFKDASFTWYTVCTVNLI